MVKRQYEDIPTNLHNLLTIVSANEPCIFSVKRRRFPVCICFNRSWLLNVERAWCWREKHSLFLCVQSRASTLTGERRTPQDPSTTATVSTGNFSTRRLLESRYSSNVKLCYWSAILKYTQNTLTKITLSKLIYMPFI